MNIEILLPNGKWSYDDQKALGPPGGFGEVFLGISDKGEQVAVKRLKIVAAEAAHRELRIANYFSNTEYPHVLPFLDSGQDAKSDGYYVVMPVADCSLEKYIWQNNPLDEIDALHILSDIANGLSEVEELVHRDLKPGNILQYKGTWRIADFGIARFVEESTSFRTLKDCLTPAYASPEQFRFERTTYSTDVYSLACIGVVLLSGSLPFLGPTFEDFKEQHLNQDPKLDCKIRPALRSLLLMMLRKKPETRPSLKRVLNVIKSLKQQMVCDESNKASNRALEEACANYLEREAERESQLSIEQDKQKKRQSLVFEAEKLYRAIRDELFQDIENVAPSAIRKDDIRLELGHAVIMMKLIGDQGGIPPDAFPMSKWDVLLGGVIAVRQNEPDFVHSSSLWYAKPTPIDDYRWREVAYCSGIPGRKFSEYEPHCVEEWSQADMAAAPGLSELQITYGPVCIDDEDMPSFKKRWKGLFAKAINNQLHIHS